MENYNQTFKTDPNNMNDATINATFAGVKKPPTLRNEYMAHNTDQQIETESKYDRAAEALKNKESQDSRSPLEQVVYETEMFKSEQNNRPWETLFQGNHRFREYQKVNMFKDYLKKLDQKGIKFNRNLQSQQNEEEFQKNLAKYDEKMLNGSGDFTDEEINAGVQRAQHITDPVYKDYLEARGIGIQDQIKYRQNSDGINNNVNFRQLNEFESYVEKTKEFVDLQRFNINPVEKNSKYVNLQSRYKDQKQIKSIIKSRRIDLRDNSDVTDAEIDKKHDDEIQQSDFAKFTKQKNIQQPDMEEFNKVNHELFRKIDIDDYKNWQNEYCQKKEMFVKDQDTNQIKMIDQNEIPDYNQRQESWDAYWNKREREQAGFLRSRNMNKRSIEEIEREKENPYPKNIKRMNQQFSKQDFLTDHQRALLQMSKKLNLTKTEENNKNNMLMHKVESTKFQDLKALQELHDHLTKEHGYDPDNVDDRILQYIKIALNRKKTNAGLSPWAKEDIFTLQIKGYDYEDISYRYGISIERVIDVVHDKRVFYEEIQPRIPKTKLRSLLKAELKLGELHGFNDQGKDFDQIVQDKDGRDMKVVFKRQKIDKMRQNNLNKLWDDPVQRQERENPVQECILEGSPYFQNEHSNYSVEHKGQLKRSKGQVYELKFFKFRKGKPAVKMNRMWVNQLKYGNVFWDQRLLSERFRKDREEGKNVQDSSKYYKIGTTYGHYR